MCFHNKYEILRYYKYISGDEKSTSKQSILNIYK